MITELFYWEFNLKLRFSRQYLSSVQFNRFSVQFYLSWRQLSHNIPTSTKRYRTISSLLNSASEIPWRKSFSSITEQIALRLISLNRGSCSLLPLKSPLWLISFPLLLPFPLLLEMRSPLTGPKCGFKPLHPVTAGLFIWDKPFLGWIRFMTLLAFWFASLQCQKSCAWSERSRKGIWGTRASLLWEVSVAFSENFTIQSDDGPSTRMHSEWCYVTKVKSVAYQHKDEAYGLSIN